MTYEITETALNIHVDPTEQANLRTIRDEEPDEWGTWSAELECLETLLANSELQWINPADTGDLTDAPMLGIWGEESHEESGPFGAVHTGGDEQGPLFAPIVARWAYMPYALRSFMDDLANNGSAVFTGHDAR